MSLNAKSWLQEYHQKSTLLGICPMSEEIVNAAFEEARREQYPPMFIATPRQVDSHRGYTGWSQQELVNFLEKSATEQGYSGQYIVARDHGGPYQSTRDRADPTVELDDAMRYAKELFLEDLEAGFDILHVDATEDPRVDGILELNEVAERTAELITYIEKERKQLGCEPVFYEVGTEEIEGGMTDPNSLSRFIQLLKNELSDEDASLFSRIVFIVGQVGTTMRIDMTNKFERNQAKRLVDIASDDHLNLKVHYTDWLPDSTLRQFPELGIGAANVGPEFAAAIIEGLAELESREKELVEPGSQSNFMETLETEVVENAPWQKFAPDNLSDTELREFAKANRRNIAYCVGRYELSNQSVESSRKLLQNNLKEVADVDAQAYLTEKVRKAIHRYVDAFNLSGGAEL